MSVKSEVAQLYVAMFGRAPDAEGLNYWAGLRESGKSIVQVADMMFGTTPARAYFPAGLSNQQIVASFYENVLGRTADAGGLAYWTGKFGAVGATPGSVIAEMIGVVATYGGTDPAGLTSAALFNNRVAAAEYFAEHNGSVANASKVLAGVSSDAATVVAARTLLLADGFSGAVDGSGYGQISVGSLSGDATVNNVGPSTTLLITKTLSEPTLQPTGDIIPTWTLKWLLADSHGVDDRLSIRVESPETVFARLQAPDVEHLLVSGVDLNAQRHVASIRFEKSSFRDTSVGGNVDMELNLSTGALDASGLTQGAGLYAVVPFAFNPVFGGPGNDYIVIGNGTVFGQGGDDSLVPLLGRAVMYGGTGADVFELGYPRGRDYSTIADFSRSEGDRIRFYDSYMVWTPSKLVLAAGSTFDQYVDACSASQEERALKWFQFGGDTYLVHDESFLPTFDPTMDNMVKLTGLIDLGALSLRTGQSAEVYLG